MKDNKYEGAKIIDSYTKQMAEAHAFKIDETFWLVVKVKPDWMPKFIYKMLIKNLIEFQQHNLIK